METFALKRFSNSRFLEQAQIQHFPRKREMKSFEFIQYLNVLKSQFRITTILSLVGWMVQIIFCLQVVEQESRLPLDLTRDSSKLAGREVRIVQPREEEEEEEVKKFLEPKSSICGQNRHADEEGKEKSTSLQRDSKETVDSEEKLGGKDLVEVVSSASGGEV